MAHFVATRAYLFYYSDIDLEGFITIRKLFTGTLYDLHVCLLILLVFYLLDVITKVRGKIQSSIFYVAFIGIGILDIVNLMIYRYFFSGLSNFGILVEYIKDLETVAVMGAKTFNPLPVIILFSPILIFVLRNRGGKDKRSSLRTVSITILSLIVANGLLNQAVQYTRINKEEVLETNTLARLLRGNKQDVELFKTIREIASTGLKKKDLELLRRYNKGKFLSNNYPLIKRDDLKDLNFFGEKPNIIFIGLESVSAFSTGITRYMNKQDQEIFKDQRSFTPFMDSLLSRSLVVPEFYSHGNLTALAQVSSLCSIYDPISAVDGQGSIMRSYPELNLKCLPSYLKEVGYKTFFFNGYRRDFDNKHIFLPKIGFDELIFRDKLKSEFKLKDYQHTWGMTDKTVLTSMLKRLNKTKKPFFSFFMSVNTHAPYDHLESKPKGMSKHEASLFKTDNDLKEFFQKAQKQKWFNNTIFVFFADNGTSFSQVSEKNELDLEKHYNRIPFFIYSENLEDKLSSVKVSSRGGQIDIAPTLMQMVGLNSTTNHYLGQSLLKEEVKRPILQYKYHNKFYTSPLSETAESLKELSMYLILNNLVWEVPKS